MLGKRKFKRVLFILIVKCFNKHTYHILSENPSSLPIILRLRFQIVVLLFYIVNFKEFTEGFVSRDSIQFLTTC